MNNIEKNKFKNLKRLLAFLKPYKFRLITALLATLVVSATTGAMAYIVEPIMNYIFVNKESTYLYILPLAVIFIFIVRGSFQVYQDYQMKYCSLKILEEMRNRLYSKIIRLPIEFFDRSQVGFLMSRVVNDVEIIRNSIPVLSRLVKRIFTVFILIGVAFYQSYFLTLCSLVVLPLVAYPIYYINKKLRKFSNKRQSKVADMSSILQEIFSSMLVIKSSTSEKKEIDKFNKENKRLRKVTMKREIYNLITSPIMELCLGIGLSIVLVFGGSLVINGEMTAGDLFSFITAISLVFNPLTKIGNANIMLQEAIIGAERVFSILDSPDIKEEELGKIELKEPFNSLSFKNIYFTYPGSNEPALKNITFEIKRGEKVAIVGPSGSGKSTIVKLITQFYKPNKGTILINDKDIKNFTLESIRKYVSIVTQGSTLFNTTIKENITYGTDCDDINKIRNVANASYADKFIRNLPKGYETLIGERGSTLSEGQKQRIIIARALLKDPELLILDEATSALDSESEFLVRKALENLLKNRTAIIIAHRLTTILNANRIIVLNKGEIVDKGTHTELLNRCDLYKKLYNLEFSSNSDNENINIL
ncbi:MAG: ABC transporter transmembrane domain-containing protein [Deferribacterota bacterium]|nr:ABC transporter transmembrane domain-containing protein [Deferribacterota bacterium]